MTISARRANKFILLAAALIVYSSQSAAQQPASDPAMHGEDRLLGQLMINQLEWRDQPDDPLVMEGQAWVGYDLDRLWLKVDSSYSDSRIDERELQALYSRAISPFWDVQAGIRHDKTDAGVRNQAVLALHGLAPYFLESEVALFVGESGDSALRLKTEYEALLTQRLILSPELKLDLHGYNDPHLGIGSGLSSVTAGLRLRYEIRRQFAPYIGLRWKGRYGQTAAYRREQSLPVEQSHWVAGVRLWF